METISDSLNIEFESLNTENHLRAKPPKQSYLYFPSEYEMVEFDNKNPKKILRRIFEGGIKFNDFEEENFINFSKFLEEKSIILPNYWEKFNTIRYLQANGYDFEKTLKFIMEHIEWRLKYLPVVPTDNVKRILNLGYLYIHGRDNRFRPILVLNPDIFVQNLNKYCLDDWINALIYMLEYIKEHCFLPGQIENWNLICDVGKSSIVFMPKELKTLMSILQSNYRCRLYVMYIVNVSLFVKVLWKTINILLDPSTQRKIKLLQGEAEIEREIFKNINRKQIEKRFGGLAENIEGRFFPPVFPSDEYFTSAEDEKVLIDEDMYAEISKSNPMLKKSPFINQQEQYLRGDMITLENRQNVINKADTSVYEDAKSHDNSVRIVNNTQYDEMSDRDKNDITVLSKNDEVEKVIIGGDSFLLHKNNQSRNKDMPEASPSKSKSVYTDLGGDIVNGCDRSVVEAPRDDLPASNNYPYSSDPHLMKPEPKNNTKYKNSSNITWENKTKTDETPGSSKLYNVQNSQQCLMQNDNSLKVSIENETARTTCCGNASGKGKCLIF